MTTAMELQRIHSEHHDHQVPELEIPDMVIPGDHVQLPHNGILRDGSRGSSMHHSVSFKKQAANAETCGALLMSPSTQSTSEADTDYLPVPTRLASSIEAFESAAPFSPQSYDVTPCVLPHSSSSSSSKLLKDSAGHGNNTAHLSSASLMEQKFNVIDKRPEDFEINRRKSLGQVASVNQDCTTCSTSAVAIVPSLHKTSLLGNGSLDTPAKMSTKTSLVSFSISPTMSHDSYSQDSISSLPPSSSCCEANCMANNEEHPRASIAKRCHESYRKLSSRVHLSILGGETPRMKHALKASLPPLHEVTDEESSPALSDNTPESADSTWSDGKGAILTQKDPKDPSSARIQRPSLLMNPTLSSSKDDILFT